MNFKRCTMMIVRLGILLFFLCGFGQATTLQGQSLDNDSAFTTVPFDRWLAAGPRKQVPWKTNVFSPELSLHQRLFTRIEIEVDGREFVKRCCKGQAVALVQIADKQGHVYRNQSIKELNDAKPGFQQYIVSFSWGVFLLPGEYQIVLAFYYSGREAHSLKVETLHVGGLKNDPLPDAWSGLPTVELCDPEARGVDEYFLPEITGRLHLPVATRRPVQIDLLVNLTPYRTEQLYTARYKYKLATFLPILKSFGQMDVGNGSLNLAILDFTRNQSAFEQDHLKNVDWPGLRNALAATDPNMIDVHDLRDAAQYAVLFREQLNRRLNDSDRAKEAEGTRAMRIIIVVSSPIQFGHGKPAPVPVPENRDFVVYYVRYEYGPALSQPNPYAPAAERQDQMGQIDDGVEKVLRPLKPRVFPAHSPEGLRNTIASILGEISHM